MICKYSFNIFHSIDKTADFVNAMALATSDCDCLPECEATEYQITATSTLLRFRKIGERNADSENFSSMFTIVSICVYVFPTILTFNFSSCVLNICPVQKVFLPFLSVLFPLCGPNISPSPNIFPLFLFHSTSSLCTK